MVERSTKKVNIVRWRESGQRRAVDEVVREVPFSLCLNGALREEGTCTPGHLEDLALGHLYTEGLLPSFACVTAVRPGPDGRRIDVEADADGAVRPFSRLPRAAWDPQTLMDTAGHFLEGSELFRSTGSVHSALLTWPGGSCRREDVGRHNALSKVVGGALRSRAPLGEAVLYTSGRLPVSLAAKIVRAGIPVVVSRSAPTDAAVELAGRWGLTVLGFARQDRMNLYTPY